MECKVNFKFLIGDLAGDEKLIQWLMDVGLIANQYVCGKCGDRMKLVARKDVTDKYEWRCRKYGENKHDVKRSLRKGSWFEESKLGMRDILLITYMWCMKISNECIVNDLGVSEKTVADWKNFCREVCVEICSKNERMIGGAGKIVEIDESRFGMRKYQRGKLVDGQWVFGGIERGTDNCFMCVVKEKSKKELLYVITKKILPGTTIISDCWKSYNCLEDKEYQHLSIKQSLTFKQPETCPHTSMEGIWASIKQSLLGNYCAGQFDHYFFEYIWRRQNKGDLVQNFLEHIKDTYVPKTHD